jgi:hypothetical protein
MRAEWTPSSFHGGSRRCAQAPGLTHHRELPSGGANRGHGRERGLLALDDMSTTKTVVAYHGLETAANPAPK